MLTADNPATRETNFALQLPASPKDSVPYIDFRTLLVALGSVAELFCKQVTGVGIALDVVLPFDPAVVLIINETTLAYFWHLPQMTAAHAFKQITAGTLSKITTNGITYGAKGSHTVTLGTGVQTTSDVVHVLALGNQGIAGGA